MDRAGFELMRFTRDADRRRILLMTRKRPMSIKELVDSCGLSLSRCYRLVNEMEELGLLHRARGRGRGAKFRSNMRSMRLSIVEDQLTLVVEFHDGRSVRHEFTPADMEALRTTDIYASTVPTTP